MDVFVIEKWDENDPMDTCVDRVFLKEENAKKYVECEQENEKALRQMCIEDTGEDICAHYVFRIVRKPIQELI